jgi:hypothetical protein
MGEMKMPPKFWLQKPEEDYHLQELAVYGRIILKRVLKSGMNVWTQLKSESFYENWDVFSSSIIARNFLTH